MYKPMAKADDVLVLVLPARVVKLEPNRVEGLTSPPDLLEDCQVPDCDGGAAVMWEAIKEMVYVVSLSTIVLDASQMALK